MIRLFKCFKYKGKKIHNVKRELENTGTEDINRGRDRAIWDTEKEQSTSSARTIIL